MSHSVTPQQQADISALYAAFWNRAPDAAGFNYWIEVYTSGAATYDQIATTFRELPEGVEAYPVSSTNEQLVTGVYNNVFGRAPDPGGLAFWTAALNQGRATFPELVIDMIEAAQGNADGALFDNKVEVGVYVATVAKSDNAYVCENAFNLVTADPASVPVAEAWVDANNTGATYTLTTNIDTINVVGQKTDSVVGIQEANNSTWNTGDKINGNNLTRIDLVGNGNPAGGASIVDANNIAAINVNLTKNTTLDETEFTSVAKIAITNGLAGGALTLDAHQLTTTLAVQKNRAFDVIVGSYDNVSGKADTVALSVADAGSLNTVFANGDALFDVSVGNAIEAVTLATSGTNFVTVDAGTAATKLTVTGNGTNNIVIANGGLAVANAIDLSATSGTNNLDIGTLISSTETVTGGSGADTLVATVAAASQILPVISGVEHLDLAFTAAGNLNASKITGATTLDLSASTAASTLSNLAAGVATLSTVASNTGAVTFGYAAKAAADVDYNIGGVAAVSNTSTTFSNIASLTVNAAGASTSNLGNLAVGATATALNVTSAKAANDLTIGTLTGAALETIAINSAGGDITVDDIAGVLVVHSLKSIDITGTGAITLSSHSTIETVNNPGGTETSSFDHLSVNLGDNSSIALGNINAGTKATSANIDRIDIALGDNIGTSTLGAISATTIGDINVSVGDNTAANAKTLTLTRFEAVDSIGNINVDIGANNTVNVTTRDLTTGASTIGDVTATGTGNFIFTVGNPWGKGTLAVGTVDASGLTTGTATIDLWDANNGTALLGGAQNDILASTQGNDTVTGNAGADAMMGGAGSDVFNYNAWSETGNTSATADTISDFATAVDLIDVTSAAGSATNYTEASGAGYATVNAAITAAAASITSTVKYVYIYNINNAGDGVLVYGESAGAATAAIQLTGLSTAAAFDYTNII